MLNANPYSVGEPVLDCAQGRPMVVVNAPEETVGEWSEREDYDLTENYANSKFGAADEEWVVECVYVSDIRSEPSKTYTFPASRLRLIDVHHADDGRRIWLRVAQEVLVDLFLDLQQCVDRGDSPPAVIEWLDVSAGRLFGDDLADEALELADVEQTVSADD